jgi:glutamate racemase
MIGFFDSGVGGLTVLEEVHKLIPEYDTIYLGDSVHAPYGKRPHKELVELTWTGVKWLFDQGCDLVIVACNSASASALREIQQTKLSDYPGKRVLGVIRPTVEELSKKGFKNILVLSTQATKDSGAYVAEFKKENPDIHVIPHACLKWASLVEAGAVGTPEMRKEVQKELRKVQNQDFDAVLLACTHYPFLIPDIETMVPFDVPVYAQGELVAKSLQDYLNRHSEIESKLEKSAKYQYFTTGDKGRVDVIATERFGFNVHFDTI